MKRNREQKFRIKIIQEYNLNKSTQIELDRIKKLTRYTYHELYDLFHSTCAIKSIYDWLESYYEDQKSMLKRHIDYYDGLKNNSYNELFIVNINSYSSIIESINSICVKTNNLINGILALSYIVPGAREYFDSEE